MIRRATARRPHDRYLSARAMLDALRRAPFIDWEQSLDENDRLRWQGTTPQRPDRLFQVELTRRSSVVWVASGRQRKNAWQRMVPDVIVGQRDDRAVAALFDEIVAMATSA